MIDTDLIFGGRYLVSHQIRYYLNHLLNIFIGIFSIFDKFVVLFDISLNVNSVTIPYDFLLSSYHSKIDP